MRTIAAYATMLWLTFFYGGIIIVATLFGVEATRDGFLEGLPRRWATWVMRASGCRIVIEGREHMHLESPHVYIGNHISWFDIFALASFLPRYRFVAKKELRRIPVFGKAAEAVAGIFIDRNNRKAAFAGYREAGEKIRAGVNVVVYPEGTRGRTYALRPFKKGPFVLAIAAQVPVVPVVTYGTIEVQGKGKIAIHPHDIEITFLEPIPTAGMTYDDRDALSRLTWSRIAGELERRHGIQSSASQSDD